MACDLCILEKRTRWYVERDEYVIIECDTCHVPMAVYKKHGVIYENIPIGILNDIRDDLARVAWEESGPVYHYIDYDMRKIKDHWHCHIRRKRGNDG